jgi:hypothetical protein
MRDDAGDKEGAARARRSANMFPNQKFRDKFMYTKAVCIVWIECGCPTLCLTRAREDPKYCIRQQQ